MIKVKLKGGLGNQMFQYAAARLLAAELQHEVGIDAQFFHKEKAGITKRTYCLDLFALKEKPNETNREESSISKALFKATYPLLKKTGHTLILRELSPADFSLCRRFKHIVLDGYFMNLRLLETREKFVQSIFEFNVDLLPRKMNLLEQIHFTNSVSVHIRRGDYLTKTNQRIYHSCDLEYYKKAMALVSSSLANPSFFIFSDDIEWAKKTLCADAELIFVEEPAQRKDALEFYSMCNCRHNIIANSTYSWWAAYLNRHPQKIVAAPSTWYKDASQNKKALEMIPAGWTLI